MVLKQKLHIGVSFLVDLFPKKLQEACDFFAKILIVLFAIVLIYYGWKFTVLMGGSTMAGTGLPSSALYACLPVSGFLYFIVRNRAILYQRPTPRI